MSTPKMAVELLENSCQSEDIQKPCLQCCPVDRVNRVFGLRRQIVHRYFPSVTSEACRIHAGYVQWWTCHNSAGFHLAERTSDMFTHKCKVPPSICGEWAQKISPSIFDPEGPNTISLTQPTTQPLFLLPP